MKLRAIILAAGEGKRMRSKLPKVLHQVNGQPMLEHVIEAAEASRVDECIVVVGHGADAVKESIPGHIKTVLQQQQLGTGHAVMMAYDHLDDDGLVMVLYGDGPLISEATLSDLMKYHLEEGLSATVLTTELENPHGYGRILRNENNELDRIVEEKDTTAEERIVREVNSGIYCFAAASLKAALPKLQNNNAQGEYYLTDVLTIIKEQGLRVGIYKISDYEEIMAVNSRQQLAEVEAIMRLRINRKHMDNGVTIINPDHTYIGKNVIIGQDTIVYPGSSIKGKTTIGEACMIGPNSNIEDSQLADNVKIESSTITDSSVGEHTTIGPYAYLRPGSRIGRHVKIGDFVEVKNASIGDYSKASHLAYIGDAEVGRHVNIGCGVVFANYDGSKKNKTVVEDYGFIGSNANLVAPVIVRERGYVASGSTITKEVPKGSLAIARCRQENKEGWVDTKEPVKK